ncbi:PTS sugar transporter subunit IIA [Sporolactobacillus pectinivorans]|uniref:PTS sugar transporter subunit IIA n=1 Tax=Sporolactobacillus pectinivorans TaxID=1591408 RepID=UPI000C25A2BB|nr:PTS sugar transporter subunit IIA [Sporolactobacillus pectinivorans]
MTIQIDFNYNDIYSLSALNQQELFDQLGVALVKRDDVTESFSEAVYIRETQYPTALDMQPVFAGGPNIAIPHTEPKYCKSRKVIVIRLNQPIDFYNMINPKQNLPVQYLFAILNNDPSAQTNILANLMDLFKSDHFLEKLGKAQNQKEVYDVLKQYANVVCA